MWGAIKAEAAQRDAYLAYRAACKAADAVLPEPIVPGQWRMTVFNDAPGRTAAEVAAKLIEAAERLEKGERV